MKSLSFALTIAAVAGMACPALAADRAPLPSSGPWTLDYDADSCALRRMFGEGEEQAYLELRRFDRNLSLQATVGTSWMRARNPANFRYKFTGDADWRQATGNAVSLTNGYSGVLFTPVLVELPELEPLDDLSERAAYLASIDWRADEKETAARTNSITLVGAFRREVTLQFGSLEAPITALQTCVDELMTHWGIDVEAHKTLTRPALPINLPEVPSMMSYPPMMLRERMPGLVNIRLDIDETGRITACHIQMPLSDPKFEESSCSDIQHALEFDPALDKDGNPIASYWVTRVVFQLGR